MSQKEVFRGQGRISSLLCLDIWAGGGLLFPARKRRNLRNKSITLLGPDPPTFRHGLMFFFPVVSSLLLFAATGHNREKEFGFWAAVDPLAVASSINFTFFVG